MLGGICSNWATVGRGVSAISTKRPPHCAAETRFELVGRLLFFLGLFLEIRCRHVPESSLSGSDPCAAFRS